MTNGKNPLPGQRETGLQLGTAETLSTCQDTLKAHENQVFYRDIFDVFDTAIDVIEIYTFERRRGMRLGEEVYHD